MVYVAGAIGLYIRFSGMDMEWESSQLYKLEINEMMMGLEKDGGFSKPDLRGKKYVREVSFLCIPSLCISSQLPEAGKKAVKDFYHARNGMGSFVQPLYSGGELLGYVRFDYVTGDNGRKVLWMLERMWLGSGVFVLLILLYTKNKIVKPFHKLSDMPYELSKGHLRGELEENRNRYFGKFIWGISMLQESLRASREKELKLEKEKKMLLLSLSHDLKIPLSTVKLYAKALEEGIYGTREEKIHAIRQIRKHALEIEKLIKDIMTASSEDLFAVEVEDGEFYLKDYMEKVRKYYEPKCRLVMTKLEIGEYGNRLLEGDMDKALEVMGNLMENALKYGDGKKIRISFYEEDSCQVIRVFNTGIPVAREEMPHLFDSFYRGSNAGDKDGNGLGLYIGREMMRKMGGDLFAERAEDGMGGCLVFTLK